MATDFKGKTYHELCGWIDCANDRDPELVTAMAELDRRRRANPQRRHYSEAMR